MSIDPVTTDANTGGSFNRYAYANNSPYKYIDPDGRSAEELVCRAPVGPPASTIGPTPALSQGWHGQQARSLNAGLQLGAGAGTGGLARGAVASLGALFKGQAAVETAAVKLFHYTDAAGAKGIAESGKIIANAKGQVFLTAEVLTPSQVTNALFIGNSGTRGSHVVELTMKQGAVVKEGKNASELVHAGTIRNGRQADLKVKINDN